MSKYIEINQLKIPVDKEGYLENINHWTPELATQIAEQSSVVLTESHWEVIRILRDFYHHSGLSPAMRILVKVIRKELGNDKGNSHYLLNLFPDSPAKLAAKIAGLPRPTNCL